MTDPITQTLTYTANPANVAETDIVPEPGTDTRRPAGKGVTTENVAALLKVTPAQAEDALQDAGIHRIAVLYAERNPARYGRVDDGGRSHLWELEGTVAFMRSRGFDVRTG